MIDQAVDGLHQDATLPVGPLRLTVPEIVAGYVLPTILLSFLRACPHVQVGVVVDNELVDIVDGGFDAAIRYEERVARDMVAVPVGPRVQCFVAAAASACLALHGRLDHCKGLSGLRLIGHRLRPRPGSPGHIPQGGNPTPRRRSSSRTARKHPVSDENSASSKLDAVAWC